MTSYKKAVAQYCRTCTYDDGDRGSCAQQIAVCRANECALHSVRPMTCTVIPLGLLKHWGITLESLDAQAQTLVRDDADNEPIHQPRDDQRVR